jgi:murein DD-endopeptidase MepM/ murein hydrolase activator NlpD
VTPGRGGRPRTRGRTSPGDLLHGMGTPLPAARLAGLARAAGRLALLAAISLTSIAPTHAEPSATLPAPPEIVVGALRLPPAPQPPLAPEERVARGPRRPEPRPEVRLPEVTTYIVEPGDSVRDIAAQFGIDEWTVLGANPEVAERPNLLFPGEPLTILPILGVLVTAGEGDTLAQLAESFEVDPAEVAAYNGLPDTGPLPAGARLVLPGARPALEAPVVELLEALEALKALEAPEGDPLALAPEEEGEQQAATLPPISPLPGASFQPIWPADGEISTYFGEVVSTAPRGHAGLDIAAPFGAPVYAAEQGEVIEVGSFGPYGLLVVLAHSGHETTWYAHLSDFAVGIGDWVERGQMIGRVGSTGYSTGPHLHFEVREHGQLRNPLNYLP